MGQPLSFFGPTQGIVQSSGLVSFRGGGVDFILDPDVTVGWQFAKDRNLIDRKNGLELDFTRASEGTFFDAGGNRQTAAIDVARFDHDRTTFVSLGLLIEEARTNEFLNSDVPVTQDVTTTAQDYTVSVYGTGSVTLSGTATGVATDGSPLTVTAGAGTLTLTVAGGPDEVQLEAGVFATSFIKTGGVSVTRANDDCETFDVSWYEEANGTFYFKCSRPTNEAPDGPFLTHVHDSSSNNRIAVSLNPTPSSSYTVRSLAASVAGLLSSETWTINTIKRLAWVYKLDDFELFEDGVRTGTGDQAGAVPIGINALHMGKNLPTFQYFNGHIDEFAYANVRKDNAFLASITAP